MSGFNYEKNLPHQEQGVQAVLAVFENVDKKSGNPNQNPEIIFTPNQYTQNIAAIQNTQQIDRTLADASNILDIAMETGTGKTYTYTKTMFDLHKMLGVFKFIVIVPTLSIKAGTKYFLESKALQEHFRDDYDGVTLKTYVVESKKNSKGKKNRLPEAISNFVRAENAREIHVLLINTGMLNSSTMAEDGDTQIDLFLPAGSAFKALAEQNAFVIIDEPHKLPKDRKTWQNVENLNPQYILRYGATFNEQYHNLIYRLTAVDAFNQNLVKGVNVFIEKLEGGIDASIKLLEIDGKEAIFELNENAKKQRFSLSKGEDLAQIHPAIFELKIDNLNKSTVSLSNGIELKKGSHFSPYAYAESLQDKMMQNAIKEHFKLERELLLSSPKIKPLTLFFIDDIAGYRNGNDISGSLKQKFESWILAEAKERLKTETDPFYREYLQKTVQDVSLTHGGYFSKDNSESDEKIEQEVNEILHDKAALLSLDNPRRFIFSKWTLREGWDNPNVFQICKLRSSGSTTSKLQEVGRGLRLPVNELMERVKDGHTLNYFVDSSEKDFVQQLIGEVNEKSQQDEPQTELTAELIEKIKRAYPQETKRSITNQLAEKGLIDDDDNFVTPQSYQEMKAIFPLAFAQGLKKDRITQAGGRADLIPMREGKYEELKALWELINQKAILQYKIKDEDEFLNLFIAYLRETAPRFKSSGVRTTMFETRINNGVMISKRRDELENESFVRFNTLNYRQFLEKLAQEAKIQIQTLHKAFYALRAEFDISQFLNPQTIVQIKGGFNQFLLHYSFSKFELGYQLIHNRIHPTAFTDNQGKPKAVKTVDLGVYDDVANEPAANYLFAKVFYDSDIERENIEDEILGVTVFTKIPRNSIKIPVAGGGTYSPDFAYIAKTTKGEILNFVIEAKGVDGKGDLRQSEKSKIKHAEQLFSTISEKNKVVFKTQFEQDRVADLIREYL